MYSNPLVPCLQRDTLRVPVQGVRHPDKRVDRAHVPVAAQGHFGSGVQQTLDGNVIRLEITNLQMPFLYKKLASWPLRSSF